ncbi:MAG: alanine--tRNA ligase [Proteobacteria bacterium]|nr:alanine--tRNA ligase [Pseudomonadota bacterium]
MKHLSDIRRTFLNYFKNQGHEVINSSPVVPQNDPTSMFTNAGMVQFKDVFTGKEVRPYKRATSSQKCIRAGGKHNDLDNVGYTARHHTFFEMLGNFSFGDYFKEDAIHFAWEMVTKEFNLPKDKLLVTVYHEDTEAFNLWKKIAGFSDDKIIKIKTADNFWSMGDTGPCGPCTEIFYDHGDTILGGPPGSRDEDGDRFIEIWNLVFMQYEQISSGNRINLPNPSIDTGMGLERVAAVLQGVHNNYQIDLFKNLIQSIEDHIGNTGAIQSYRVIADHLRACSFMVADGITPSNEGRGYVLRRILRRAMRHAHLLGAKEPLMHKLVPTLLQTMGDAYPELNRAKEFIKQTFKGEEEKFRQTLDKGLRLLRDEKESIRQNILSGDVAFKLYDTYGFPFDLTQDILRQENISVDVDGFNQAMTVQKERARQAWVGSGETSNDAIYFDLKQTIGTSEFLGYTTLTSEAVVQAIIKEGVLLNEASKGDEVLLVFNQTPFYAESGGQKGDCGEIVSDDVTVQVLDVQKKLDDIFVHKSVILKGTIKKGDALKLIVNEENRLKTAANHSATHLLHKALRSVLGEHVVQKGSLVGSVRLRFDFTHNHPLTKEEISAVESIVNKEILKNQATKTLLMTPDEAINQGALALFGERYGDEVRVVSIGGNFSTELCGGTHVSSTGDIGLFKIISESSIASGIRRIEAMTGLKIVDEFNELETKLDNVIKDAKEEKLSLNKQITQLKQQLTLASLTSVDETIIKEDVQWSIKHLKDVNPSELRAISDHLLQKFPGVMIVTTVVESKISLSIAVSKELFDRIQANKLIPLATEHLKSKGGGGKPDFAQGGGVDTEKLLTLLKELTR